MPIDPRTLESTGPPKRVGGKAYTRGLSPDGQRFLLIKTGDRSSQPGASPQLIVAQHWTEELKRLLPTK